MIDAKHLDTHHCFICGSDKGFAVHGDDSLREAVCRHCSASLRNSDVGQVILEIHGGSPDAGLLEEAFKLESLSIYEAQAGGAVFDCLNRLPGYVCSEYDRTNPNFDFGSEVTVQCETLENLTFEDDRFDLVITQDIFEHIKYPDIAFLEVNRVLKPGGHHVFTVPYHHGRKTVSRITACRDRELLSLPPVYHGDAFKKRSSIVYTDFGDDLIDILNGLGCPTHVALEKKFYPYSAIPFIQDREEYERYMAFEEQGRELSFFLYNSLVFVSIKEEKTMPAALDQQKDVYMKQPSKSCNHRVSSFISAGSKYHAPAMPVIDRQRTFTLEKEDSTLDLFHQLISRLSSKACCLTKLFRSLFRGNSKGP